MFSFVKVSRLRRPIQEISIMVRNSSHFTYAPDPPVENMGKHICPESNQLKFYIPNIPKPVL